MKKKIIAAFIGAALLTAGVFWLKKNTPYDETFLIPNGYSGCVYVVYEIQGTPELTTKNHTIQYKIDNDGILLTSSTEDFGWEGKASSGLHDINYFYVNENEKKVKEIHSKHIGPMLLGEYSEEGRVITKRLTFSVNAKGATCENFVDLENKIQKKLNNH